MLPEVRAALDAIEDVLLRRDQVAMDLANILSALRGPDSMCEEVKGLCTVPVRRAAFPRLAEQSSRFEKTSGNGRGWWMGKYAYYDGGRQREAPSLPDPQTFRRLDEHLREHFQLAYDALVREAPVEVIKDRDPGDESA